MDEEVMDVLFEIEEELTGYIGQWLDEKPDFHPSNVEDFMDELYSRIVSKF